MGIRASGLSMKTAMLPCIACLVGVFIAGGCHGDEPAPPGSVEDAIRKGGSLREVYLRLNRLPAKNLVAELQQLKTRWVDRALATLPYADPPSPSVSPSLREMVWAHVFAQIGGKAWRDRLGKMWPQTHDLADLAFYLHRAGRLDTGTLWEMVQACGGHPGLAYLWEMLAEQIAGEFSLAFPPRVLTAAGPQVPAGVPLQWDFFQAGEVERVILREPKYFVPKADFLWHVTDTGMILEKDGPRLRQLLASGAKNLVVPEVERVGQSPEEAVASILDAMVHRYLGLLEEPVLLSFIEDGPAETTLGRGVARWLPWFISHRQRTGYHWKVPPAIGNVLDKWVKTYPDLRKVLPEVGLLPSIETRPGNEMATSWQSGPETRPLEDTVGGEGMIEPTSRPRSIEPMDSASQGIPEAELLFNSKLALRVWAVDEGGENQFIGLTPSAKPLAIPKDRRWFVQPLAGVVLADLRSEAQIHPIQGLKLTDASDADLAQLRGWPKLEVLNASGPAQGFGRIGGQVTDVGLAHIGELKTLQILVLGGTRITDAGLVHLKQLKVLQRLELYETQITDSGLVHMAELTGLQSLGLAATKVTDVGLARLKELQALRSLDLAETRITDAGLFHLKKLKALQWVYLGGTKIADIGLAHLEDLQALQRLDLASTQIVGAGLAHLVGLRGLRSLTLRNSQITDAGMAYVESLKNLEVLDLGSTKITDIGLAHVKELKALQDLDLWDTKITDAGLAHIRDLKALRQLNLGHSEITDAGLAHIEGLRDLQALWLDSTKITDAGLAHIKGLKGLQRIGLSRTIADAGLAYLKQLNALRELHLEHTQITDAGVAQLADLKGIEWLDLSFTQVSDAGLAGLKGLTGLRELRIRETRITDAGLTRLKELKGLQTLRFGGASVSRAGLDALRKARPDLEIEP